MASTVLLKDVPKRHDAAKGFDILLLYQRLGDRKKKKKQISGSTVTLMTEEVEWNQPKCLCRSMDHGIVVFVTVTFYTLVKENEHFGRMD